MDDLAKELLRRIVRRIPTLKLESILRKWERLTRPQLQTLQFTQPKWLLCENLLTFCEENALSVRHVTEIEMLYYIEFPNRVVWHACQLIDPEDVAQTSDLERFRESFTAHIKGLINHVSVKVKKHSDESVWIRLAWGDNFSRPNHFKPTYIVHYLQTPYVFVSSLTAKHRPYLYQALALATQHSSIKDVQLTGRCLTALRDLLMRQYTQVFPSNQPKPSKENNVPKNPNIKYEHTALSEQKERLASEAFGCGDLPKLETAIYKLETRYKEAHNGTLSGREEPFRCVVKFTSSNLLESLKHCVASNMATSITPLLSSITHKGRNYFVIKDKGTELHPQTPAGQ